MGNAVAVGALAIPGAVLGGGEIGLAGGLTDSFLPAAESAWFDHYLPDAIIPVINENQEVIGSILYKDIPAGSFMSLDGKVFVDSMHVLGGALGELFKLH